MTARRRRVSAEEAAAAGRRVCAHLVHTERVASAARVALYAALPDELPTRDLFEVLRGRGALLLPRCGKGGRLEFAEVERWEDLRPGRYGVLEPGARAPATPPSEGDVVLVPGLAFDLAGRRLGRGSGWYDRTFPPGAIPAPWLVGLAYEFQRVEHLPHEAHDRRVDAVCTEAALHVVTGESA